MYEIKKEAVKLWPLICPLLLFIIISIVLLNFSINLNGKNLVYSLDDTYIHMAIAKNTVNHGIWGVNKEEFSSSSSSPAWTTIIAIGYFIFGVNDVLPFVLNVFIALLIIYFIYIFYLKEKLNKKLIFIFLTANILLIPIPALIFTGLEHLLHIFLTIVFVYFSSEVITSETVDRKNIFWLACISLILPVIRYEGLVIIIFSVFLMLLNKKWTAAIIIMFSSLLLMTLFGFYSISNGWSFFPNSLLLKATLPDINSFSGIFPLLNSLLGIYFTFPLVIFIFIPVAIFIYCLVFFIKKNKELHLLNRKLVIINTLVTINILIFVFYSDTGWNFRYQAFLVTLILFTLPVTYTVITKSEYFLKLKSNYFTKIFVLILISFFILLFGFFTVKSFYGLYYTPQMTNNIYEQQIQIARFVDKYYNEKIIGLNDIGAVSYYTEANVVDLLGIANLQVSGKVRRNKYYSKDVTELAESSGIKISIVYESLLSSDYSSLIPAEWIKAGDWTITNNLAAGYDKVSIYAVNEDEYAALINNLKSFSKNLPVDIIQTGIYTDK